MTDEPKLSIQMAQRIELWPLDRLKPYERNARTHSAEQVAQIAASIVEFGFTNPILVDSGDGIIAGHGRLQAARELGLSTVPVVVLDHLSDRQRRAYVLADNQLALNAGWDLELLRTELQDLVADDFDLSVIGFSDEELEDLLPDIEQLASEELGDADAVPEPPADPVTKPGDVWLLGKHRVMCGDSTDVLAVEKLMAGKKAQTFFTDPPYGDNVGGLQTKSAAEREPGKGLVKRVSFIANDKEIDWLEEVFNLVPGFLEADNTKMVFFKWDRFEQIKSMAAGFGEPSALCVWDRVRKASAFFRFQPQHELCLHWGNQADKKEPADLSNVWRVPKELDLKELHPTVKPMAIIEPALRVTTDKGKRVLDLFGGSGTTLIAAETSGRIAHLMELDPRYVDVIVKRWQAFTGKRATLEATGEVFAEDAA
jgi:ParB-like chromosome segregation protein Spo0J